VYGGSNMFSVPEQLTDTSLLIREMSGENVYT
jgi:hypothetical protein